VFGKKPSQKYVISSADVEAALAHINSMPQMARKVMPGKWGFKILEDMLLASLPAKAKSGDCFCLGPGLWGHIRPLEGDFQNHPNSEHRLQVVVSIRSVLTSLDNLIVLN